MLKISMILGLHTLYMYIWRENEIQTDTRHSKKNTKKTKTPEQLLSLGVGIVVEF